MLSARAAAPDDRPSDGVPLPPLDGPLVADGGGKPSAQPLIDGRRLDDLVGPAWLVVLRDPEQAESESARWWREQGATVLTAEQHQELTPLLGSPADADSAAVVIRPDRYVFGVGSLVELTTAARQALAPG